MTDFAQTTTVKKSHLALPALLTWQQHAALVAEIATDPFGFGRVEQTENNYAYISQFEDNDGTSVGTLRIDTPVADADTVPYGYSSLLSDLSVPAPAFPDATEHHDQNEDLFHAKFRCENETESFYLTLDRDEMWITGYEDDAVVTTVATWAGTKTELGGAD